MPQNDDLGIIFFEQPVTPETPPKKSYWTPEKVTDLKALWEQGYSAGRIAGVLGNISRNAVIGKLHRMGLPRRPQDKNKQYHMKRVRTIPQNAPHRPSRARRLVLPPTPLPPQPVDDNRPGVSLFDLTPHSCRAVIRTSEVAADKEAHFCGERVQDNQSFCPGHYALYYNIPRLVAAE